MHHMCPRARLRPPVRVALVLGRFPRLTRPGPDPLVGALSGRTRAVREVVSAPPFQCVSGRASDCAPGEQGCAGAVRWCVMDA